VTISLAIYNTVPFDHSALAAQITTPTLVRLARALQIQAQSHIAPHGWPNAISATARVLASSSDLAPTDSPAFIVPSLDDAPGAIAYHDDQGTDPDSYLALDTCNTLADVTTAQSHEWAEIMGDPECTLWVTVPAGLASYPKGVTAGQQIALELSDPVQDRSYPIDLGGGQPPVMMSDFALPAYFDVTLTGPTTYCEAIGAAPRIEPFQRSAGGYQLVRNGDGTGETQAFGMISPKKLLKAKHPKTRLARRGIKIRKAPEPTEAASTMLGRAHQLFEMAHDGLHILEGTGLTEEQNGILAQAHRALHAGHDELHAHLDAAEEAKRSAQMQVIAYGALFAGALIGHVSTVPREPKREKTWSIPPEMKAKGLQLFEQLAPIVTDWLKK
jgi:hypothetical protein